MTYYISNDHLAHHGVKGMHWGIRKSRSSSGRSRNSSTSGTTKKKRIRVNRGDLNSMGSDADRAITGISRLIPRRKKVDLSKYSDAELNRIINRQQLEQRYNQLNPDRIDRGAAYLRETLQTGLAVGGLYLSYKALKKTAG